MSTKKSITKRYKSRKEILNYNNSCKYYVDIEMK